MSLKRTDIAAVALKPLVTTIDLSLPSPSPPPAILLVSPAFFNERQMPGLPIRIRVSRLHSEAPVLTSRGMDVGEGEKITSDLRFRFLLHSRNRLRLVSV